MRQQLHPGQEVTVNAFPGKHPIVTVVEDRGDVVLICKPEEYKEAISQNRVAASIGFRREDVLDILAQRRKGATSESATEGRGLMAGD